MGVYNVYVGIFVLFFLCILVMCMHFTCILVIRICTCVVCMDVYVSILCKRACNLQKLPGMEGQVGLFLRCYSGRCMELLSVMSEAASVP